MSEQGFTDFKEWSKHKGDDQKKYMMPNRDDVTVAISHQNGDGIAAIMEGWAQELISYAQQRGYHVIDIFGRDDKLPRPCEFLHDYHKLKPAVLFNFFPAKLPIQNLKSLDSAAVITFSGKTGFQIGQDIIKAGSPVFVGFNENIIIVSSHNVSDNYQDVFRAGLLSLAKMVLDGHAIGAAVVATRIGLLNTIKKYNGRELISVPLFYDMKALTLIGDARWKLTPKDLNPL